MKEEEIKLPMYFEQINTLMKLMAKYFINGRSYRHYLTTMALYNRIRPDLTNERKTYFDSKKKELDRIRKNKCSEHRFEALAHPSHNFEMELFEELNKLGVFKKLKEKQVII